MARLIAAIILLCALLPDPYGSELRDRSLDQAVAAGGHDPRHSEATLAEEAAMLVLRPLASPRSAQHIQIRQDGGQMFGVRL